MARPRVGLSLLLLLASSSFSLAQNPPQSDPEALKLAAQSIAAMTGGTPISDVALTGDVSWSIGSDPDTGTATLWAKGVSESRIDLKLSQEQRSEVRNGASGSPLGTWSDTDGVAHPLADQNCWTDAAWFFPPLSSLAASGPNVVLTYVGLEKRGDIAVQHLQSYVYTSGPDSKEVAFTGQLSGMDFYLDAATLLPLTLTFNVHPDDDASTNIPVEIDFSKYQSVDGVQVAYHVQKFFRGGLMIDFNATSVAVNSGLPDSLFAVQ